MEENKNVSKNGWKRIFGKKWFFPAVYLTIAALLLTGVLWYQNLDNQIPEASEDPQTELGNDYITGDNTQDFDEDSRAVMEQQEVVKMPVAEGFQTEIVTKFYDYSADSEDQEKALVLYNNKYYQSKGIDIASAEDESFDVTASLSGTVTEVKEDPLLGNVIEIEHVNDITTHYASLDEVLVETGAKVKQGDAIGTAGRNLFGQASGTHVHFELRKAGEAVNPEDFFNQPLNEVKDPASNDSEASESDEEADEQTEQDQSVEDEQDDSSNQEDDETEEDGAEEEDNTTNETESSAAMANA